MGIPALKSKFVPSQFIKVAQRMTLDQKIVSGQNIIVTRNVGQVDLDSLVLLGKVLEHKPQPDYFGFNIWLDVSYPYVALIAGRRGTGKTYTLGVFAEGFALTLREAQVTTKNSSHALLIIDTLGQFWQMRHTAAARNEEEKQQLKQIADWGLHPCKVERTQVYVPAGTKIVNDWKELRFLFSDVQVSELAALMNVDLYQDRMGQLLYHVYSQVAEEGYQSASVDEHTGTLVIGSTVKPKRDFEVSDLIQCIDHDHEVISSTVGFEVQTRRALRSRLEVMSRWKIFSSSGTAISEVFKKGYATVLNLEGIDEDLRNLIVGVVVRKIFQARESTRKREKLAEVGASVSPVGSVSVPQGWILVDEAHEFCPAAGSTASKEPLIKLAKEGRSLGLGLIIATQQPSALSEKLSSQVELVVSHALAFAADIRSLTDRFVNSMTDKYEHPAETLTFEQQIRLLPPGTAMVSAVGMPRVFLATVRPRLALHGGRAPKMD
jgi:hypothetical protein